MDRDIKVGGLYRHYKNKNFYRVLSVAKHSETLEDLVVYEAQYDNPLSKVWVRPISMFTEEVDAVDGLGKTPRFEYVS